MNQLDTFFSELCEKYYNDVYKYLAFTLKNSDTANDAIQDTFVIVYKNIKNVYKHPNAGGYVFRTAQNIAKNYKKNIYKRIINEINIDNDIIELQDYKSEISNAMDTEINEYDYITEVIESLNSQEKRLYDMYYIEHKQMKEIAQELNIEYTALRMKYVRLRKKIKATVRELSEKYFVT